MFGASFAFQILPFPKKRPDGTWWVEGTGMLSQTVGFARLWHHCLRIGTLWWGPCQQVMPGMVGPWGYFTRARSLWPRQPGGQTLSKLVPQILHGRQDAFCRRLLLLQLLSVDDRDSREHLEKPRIVKDMGVLPDQSQINLGTWGAPG